MFFVLRRETFLFCSLMPPQFSFQSPKTHKNSAAKKKYACPAEKKAAMAAKKGGAGESGESGEGGADLCKPKKVKVRGLGGFFCAVIYMWRVRARTRGHARMMVFAHARGGGEGKSERELGSRASERATGAAA